MTRACDGCLGTTQCWICTGEGCLRCEATGRCHLCRPEPVTVLLPAERQPVDAPATATAS